MMTLDSNPIAWHHIIQNMFKNKFKEREIKILTELSKVLKLQPSTSQLLVSTKAPQAATWA